MRGKKKYGWLSGLMSNVLGGTREYNFNNVTYSKDKTPRPKEGERREEYVLRIALLCRLR